ncbi:hypothetical protein FA95DRAFT_1605561 [Auriscalpium vulgare]|uniref:Uncharacterized protein n=1 Tax=Auriscalpium vulgare TaxID=40419 RepID=A0ACB8RW45_9AGAM|nr:hypothetical protein FA95DRAFT_1605561 [Auriscalpium vulgare]
MLRTAVAILSLAASTLAYSVSNPGTSLNWTTTGPNTVSWQRVSTDPSNFTLLLVNQDKTVLPSGSQVLSSFVDGSSASSFTVPSTTTLPAGDGFQVNLVQDANDLNAIYAQSQRFSIKQGTASSSPSSSASTSTSASASLHPSITSGASSPSNSAGSTDGGDLNPTSITNTTAAPNAAGRLVSTSGGVMILLAALGAMLA